MAPLTSVLFCIHTMIFSFICDNLYNPISALLHSSFYDIDYNVVYYLTLPDGIPSFVLKYTTLENEIYHVRVIALIF